MKFQKEIDEIASCQMQYDASGRDIDQKINAKYILEGTVLQNVEKNLIP